MERIVIPLILSKALLFQWDEQNHRCNYDLAPRSSIESTGLRLPCPRAALSRRCSELLAMSLPPRGPNARASPGRTRLRPASRSSQPPPRCPGVTAFPRSTGRGMPRPTTDRSRWSSTKDTMLAPAPPPELHDHLEHALKDGRADSSHRRLKSLAELLLPCEAIKWDPFLYYNLYYK